jgi:isopropylmalate/homocitrate/citramalate synthase
LYHRLLASTASSLIPGLAMTNLRFFRHLVQIGFKEIEVSYPAASDSDFNFCRELLNGGEVPDDVWIQVRRSRSSTQPSRGID